MSAAAQEPLASITPLVSSGRRIALVVGVNGRSVPERETLKYAVQDASDMAEVLQGNCGFELFRPPLLEEQATTESVRQAVLDLADELNDHDFLLFYFSGHGEPMKIQADLVLRSLSGDRKNLCKSGTSRLYRLFLYVTTFKERSTSITNP
jgi:uncharacterized caspase-like protein